ncbi:hypothetical protein OTK49_01070 [Vibrio coralliirubri]|uniref:hypothetical protein n=1 Tax=Vibrio coralliirubri TaxID=1516159 RepID=UPI0022848637|nr:hypothetical protein [Vibrio coralliirubri]MCY9861120.1 hypothetical protein [Vibrio coralliirubri]
MRLRNFAAFVTLTYLSIAILISACASLLFAVVPDFMTTAFDHGGFALTFMLVMSARSSLMYDNRKLVTNRTWYRRLASLLSFPFGAFVALAVLIYTISFAGYDYVSPDISATVGVYVFNVVWFFIMIGLIEISSKITEPFIERSLCRA